MGGQAVGQQAGLAAIRRKEKQPSGLRGTEMRYRDGQRGGKKDHWQEGQQRQKRYLHAKLLHRQVVHQDGEKKAGRFVE
jgi:hypothetical protein